MERLNGAICRFEYSLKTHCCSSTYSHSNGSLFEGDWGEERRASMCKRSLLRLPRLF